MQFIKTAVVVLFSGLFLLFTGCFTFENDYSVVPPGRWRAVLELTPSNVPVQVGQRNKDNVVKSIEEFTEGQLPFNFEVTYIDETRFYIEIINGPEKIKIEDIKTWHDRATNQDSILINFPVYGTYIKAGFEDDKIEGNWFVPYRGDDYRIPFYARFGKGYRFTQLQKAPTADLSGKWQVEFSPEEDPYNAIGEFQQAGNELTGTFRTETGDYRYLAGTVQEDKAYLSCFDGAHAFLFEAKIQEDESLFGSFRSGSHYRTIWNGVRNNDYELGSPDSLTYLKEGYDRFSFSLPNIDGKTVSLEDAKYQNKVKIIQIMGTWCPNCRDETNFLVDYLMKNPYEDLAVIGIGFERFQDQAKNLKALETYKEKFGMKYELLLGGYFDKKEAGKTFPMLNHILSYPTMIFIDRDNQVRRIHTGFSGPATSTYEAFVADFDSFVKSLLEEKNELN